MVGNRDLPPAAVGEEPAPPTPGNDVPGRVGPPPGKPRFKRPVDYAAKAALIADKLAALRGRIAAGTERKARLAKLIAEGADVMQIVGQGLVAQRHFEILLLDLSGTERHLIAKMYERQVKTIAEILNKPEIVYMKRAIQRAQLEKVVNGEFGARAAAKAAFPTITERVIEKAGGKAGYEPAVKDADMLRAAELVGKIAGDLGEERNVTHNHFHAILRDMTPAELTKLRDTQEWPERYKGIARQLKLPAPS